MREENRVTIEEMKQFKVFSPNFIELLDIPFRIGVIILIGYLMVNSEHCNRIRAECEAQNISWEKLKPGQQVKPCGGDKTIKRIPGGVIVTHEGYKVGSTAFIPMKFED
jgi:hypothetical protein